MAGSPLTVETFSGIDRRGDDFGLRPWQATNAVNVQPIDDGRGICLRAPQEALGGLSGDKIGAAGSIMGPFHVGADVVGLYDGNIAEPVKPSGITKLLPIRALGLVPSPSVTWTYLGHTVIGSTLCVLTRWSDDTSIHLHVLDGAVVSDVNGTGSPWLLLGETERAYTPVIGEAGGRVWISSPTGELWFCAIGRPRIWWTKTADDISATGYEWNYTPPASTAVPFTMLVPYLLSDVLNPDRWCGAAVEVQRTDQNSQWIPIPATWATGPGPTGPAVWTLITVVSGVLASYAGLRLRLRIVPPRAEAGSKRRFVRSLDIENLFEERVETWKGDGTTKVFTVRDPASMPLANWAYPDPSEAQFFTDVIAPSGGGATSTLGAGRSTVNKGYDTTPIDINGIKTSCVKLIIFDTAPVANAEVILRWKRLWNTGANAGPGQVSIEPNRIQTASGKTIVRQFTMTRVNSSTAYQYGILQTDDPAYGTVFLVSETLGAPLYPRDPDLIYMGRTDSTPTNIPSGATADAAWDEARWQEALLLAGDGRAGILPTSQHAAGESGIRQIVGTRNRLLITYANSMQLWQVDGAPSAMGKLDASPIGAGLNPAIRGCSYGELAVLPFTNGIAAISLTGQLNERMASVDMAGEIFGTDPGLLGIPTIHDITTWPHMSAIVVALTLAGDTYASLWLLISDKEGKSLGWWKWTVGNMAIRPGTLMAVGDRLYWHGANGTALQSLRAGATRLGAGIVGSVSFCYQNGGDYESYKRWISMDIVGKGLIGLSATPLANRVARALGNHTGNGYARRSTGLMFTDTAAAFTLTLEDIDGNARVDRLSVRFVRLRR